MDITDLMNLIKLVASAVTAVLTVIGTFLGLFTILPGSGGSRVSRTLKKAKGLTDLEPLMDDDRRTIIRLQKECLASETVERLAYKTYMWRGKRSKTAQQGLGCGYFSLSIIGIIAGMDLTTLLLLVCSSKQDNATAQDDTVLGLLALFFAILLLMLLLAKFFSMIYVRVALRQQFRLDMLPRLRGNECRVDDSLIRAMDDSYDRLCEYEKKRTGWKEAIALLWIAFTMAPFVSVIATTFKWIDIVDDIALVVWLISAIALIVVGFCSPKLADGRRESDSPEPDAEENVSAEPATAIVEDTRQKEHQSGSKLS